MRASRAYIAGFGTTSVLVSATLLLFLVVSALVAFKAWPGSGITDALGALVVDDSRPALTVDGPTQVALDAAPAAAAVGTADIPVSAPAGAGAVAAGGPLSGTAPVAPPVTNGGGGSPRSVTGVGRGTQPPAAGTPSQQPAQPGAGAAPGGNGANGLGGVTNGLGDTTQGLTDGLDQTVSGVNPELGKTVTDTGQALSDLVSGLGGK